MTQYVRVYYSIVDDERFECVYGTPHLATWLRLLLLADAMWPASAHIPATERRASLAVLTSCGLIEMLPGGRFRVHGLDSERERRKEAAAIGGRARQRTLSERSANAMPPLSLAKQSKDKQSRAEQVDPLDERVDIDAFVATRFRLPTPGQRAFMDAYVATFDQTGPERASRLIWGHPDDPIGAMKEDLAAFREERKAEALASEVPKPKRTNGSGMSRVSDEIAKLYLAPSNGGAVPLSELVSAEALASLGRKP